MARFNKGILGGFSGKVGTVVGAKWRGQDIMRSLPSKSSKKATDAQLKQRAKFSLIARFLAPVRKITAQLYGEYQGTKSRTDLAMSYQMTDVVIEKPDGSLEIDFKKVTLSKGHIPIIPIQSTTLENSKLTIAWLDNTDEGNAKANDNILVIVYSKEFSEFSVHSNTSALRKDKKLEVTVPAHWKKNNNIVWAIVSNSARNQGSNSIFLGEV